MKPNKKDILKWTKALRSGEYVQTRGTLQDSTGFCCLGVACDTFIEKDLLTKEYGSYGEMCGAVPEEQANAPIWLAQVNDDFLERTTKELTSLNDDSNFRFSFDEIADLLEAVYVHEVLNER